MLFFVVEIMKYTKERRGKRDGIETVVGIYHCFIDV